MPSVVRTRSSATRSRQGRASHDPMNTGREKTTVNLTRKISVFGVLTLFLLSLSIAGMPAIASSVGPTFVPDNPSCADLGYAFEFKIESGFNGTHDIDGVNTVTVSANGRYFDWESTLRMDAVIAKGGPDANAYVYGAPARRFSIFLPLGIDL